LSGDASCPFAASARVECLPLDLGSLRAMEAFGEEFRWAGGSDELTVEIVDSCALGESARSALINQGSIDLRIKAAEPKRLPAVESVSHSGSVVCLTLAGGALTVWTCWC
jgi:hypothetical protein